MDVYPAHQVKPLLDAPLAIVDVETTGAHPAWDRVTEIAVVEVEGSEVVSEWSTLVNPGASIPPAIQALTGITNAMVADAPAFEDLAADLYERLEGRIFVAHNARFDYGFLRHEFERAGLRFQARTLCTVKLSRRLYPGHARHNLDSLIDRHGLKCGLDRSARHRALGDAQAVWQFLQVAAEERGADEVAGAARQLAQLPALPAHIERAAVDAIPESPGVYLFYGERDTPLYVGKSIAMRSRVLQHFAGDLHSSRDAQIAREIRRIEWRRTCGELGALLREAQLVKELLPVFNRQLRRESVHAHHARAAAALAGLKTAAWPWRGPIGIVEEDREREAAEVHVVNNWCLLGTANSESEVAELLQGPMQPRFDLDHYKILARHLAAGRAKVVELGARVH
jgi:DNA polymerase III subunit epsilon